jgi:hypothetical protein
MMNSHDLQNRMADTIFESRKGGKPVTIKLKNGHIFKLDDFKWCGPCEQFHLIIGDPV